MTTRRRLLAGLLFTAVMAGLGVLAAWPIYADLALVWVALAATGAGLSVAVLSRRFTWSWWISALALAGAWLVIGFLLAVPARWESGALVPDALIDVIVGPVTGWKDLITVPLPVGTYRNLLVPALIVFLLGSFFAARTSWRVGSSAVFAVPIAGLMPVFGLWFGRTSTSVPVRWGGVRLDAPVEIATGAAAVLVSVLWLAWRARDTRRDALRRAETATGIRGRSPSDRPGAVMRRAALAVGMVVVASLVGVLVTPAVAETRNREVLRSAIGPDLSITQALSPLATYRTNFSDDEYARTLFTVTSTGVLPERIRIATLAAYDGETYRATEDMGGDFRRVPSRLATPPGELSSVRFDIDALRGVWLPTFGSLSHVDFAGADAPTLADRFYYDPQTGTAVESGGLDAGVTYTVTAAVPPTRTIDQVPSPGVPAPIEPPETLTRWLDAVGPTRDGAGLAEAIAELRSRGYLSHALRSADGEPAAWMRDLGEYDFRSSAAGHSLARVDDLFRQLLEREAQAKDQGAEASLVAAVGDDEQFAVAGALIAQQLGFPARVVVGVRTSGEEGLPACAEGVCTAGDVSAWIEVHSGGEWIAVDTTPQHTEDVSLKTRQQRDPENMTSVRPDSAREVPPPDPQSQESDDSAPPASDTTDLTAMWTILTWVGIGLLSLVVLLAPFLTVLIAKVARRRRRRQDPDVARRVAGGWDDYVDAAVDAGRPAPTVETRRELAAVYATPGADDLAVRADRAVFAGAAVSASEAEEFWGIVRQEQRELRSGAGWWARVRQSLSLRSFRRLALSRRRDGGSGPRSRAG